MSDHHRSGSGEERLHQPYPASELSRRRKGLRGMVGRALIRFIDPELANEEELLQHLREPIILEGGQFNQEAHDAQRALFRMMNKDPRSGLASVAMEAFAEADIMLAESA